ncbi:MAG: BrnA antitoxin family protein [Defluviitaleaceae bacterium]|nr:BrnA antitoxin family protein [Defluviitaleaceae bacterium]
MTREIEYTDAPEDIEQSLDRAVIVPNFALTPEEVKAFVKNKTNAKRPVSIYLSVDTIEKFKKAAKETGGRYQTMISNVLDTYTQQNL